MTREEAINSSAYKMLNFLIKTKSHEMLGWMNALDSTFNRAKKDNPTFSVGTTFDEVREIEVPFEIYEVRRMSEIISEIQRLEREIRDLNSHKLYLIQADADWSNSARSEAVFGVTEYD